MKATFYLLVLTFLATQGARPESRMDGTWYCHWVNTTPKGLHNDVKRTLVIRTNGTSTQKSVNDLSVSTPSGRKTLRIVQRSHSTSSEVREGVLIIHWAPLELVSPAAKDMPPGLHWQSGPLTLRFTLRGDKLTQISEDDVVFTRVK